MRYLIILFTSIFIPFLTSSGQTKNIDGSNYSPAIQLDSSNFYIIGYLMDKTNRTKYNSDAMEIYGPKDIWTNVALYNSSTRKSKKIFPNGLFRIYPLYSGVFEASNSDYGFSKNNFSSVVLKNGNILFSVKSDEYNNDGVIDEDDPIYLFVCTRDGSGLTQIGPKGMNLTSFRMSKDGKTILAYFQNDNNGDKKFSSEDEVLYQINITQDISKTETTQITL